jgi:1,4-dihydroxy-2-naphthoyl-CoA synthase
VRCSADTHDWFAQDDDGNVWYMGEDVINYEYDDDDNLIGTNNDGAWEAGVDDALPGIIMWADLEERFSYYQEYWEDEAEDMGMIVATGVEVELENGTIYENCLQILDWNPLAPETLEYKYYAPDVGLVKEEVVGGDETAELI